MRRALVAALAFLAVAGGGEAQTFTKLEDLANPVVADSGGFGYAGASWVDADADGWDDLFVGGRALYRNHAGVAFSRIVIPGNTGVLGNSWADIDNDGDADVMLASGAARGSRLYRNDGMTFVRVTGGAIGDSLENKGWACAWGDYDSDGRVDLVIVQPSGFPGFGGPNHLLHAEADGTYTQDLSTDVTVGLAPYTVPTWSDFDLDGDLDLGIAAGPANGNRGRDYFYGNLGPGGAPRLQRLTTGRLATDTRDGQIANWIDYDNDGDVDCYITNYFASANHLYRNDAGTWVRMTGTQAGPIVSDIGFSLASVWNDYDNDGDLDCFVGRTNGYTSRYYRNEGGGVFQSVELGPMTSSTAPTTNAVAADYDHDGDLDLYVSGALAIKGLYRNDTEPGRHWLQVRLTGVQSNRSAIGARVHVVATIGGAAVPQLREVSAQNSFNGHSSFVQHFGLGDATRIDELRVVWPSGLVETLRDVPVDTLLDLREGDHASTATLASGIAPRVTADGVALAWYGNGLARVADARVERRDEAGGWTSRGTPRAEGADRLTFVDAPPPGRWAYRLAFATATGPWTSEEAWIEVPGPSLSLRVIAATSGQPLRVAFELPRAGATRLRVLDPQGRQVAEDDLGVRPAGPGERTLHASIAPGVYWVRLVHGGRAVAARAIVLR